MKRRYLLPILFFSFFSIAAFSQQTEKKPAVKEVISNSGEKNIPRNIQQDQLKAKPENLTRDKPVAKAKSSAKKKACCAKCKRKTNAKRPGA